MWMSWNFEMHNKFVVAAAEHKKREKTRKFVVCIVAYALYILHQHIHHCTQNAFIWSSELSRAKHYRTAQHHSDERKNVRQWLDCELKSNETKRRKIDRKKIGVFFNTWCSFVVCLSQQFVAIFNVSIFVWALTALTLVLCSHASSLGWLRLYYSIRRRIKIFNQFKACTKSEKNSHRIQKRTSHTNNNGHNNKIFWILTIKNTRSYGPQRTIYVRLALETSVSFSRFMYSCRSAGFICSTWIWFDVLIEYIVVGPNFLP